ncbi:TonB-dependent receptor domain-containing protein [Sphingomonas colocasiae]|uniref:TonB-dependent receptor n=1 Tax=Sphingomonas colocasiae TaxID=1848973 RepID=A0ABS7Q118_9SPHN|nr:TonB-dependent receptor [Sphingomonas colocasiae]MBY8826232.1 TonB-dependent receptor [Sphingomonas colocasiae]
MRSRLFAGLSLAALAATGNTAFAQSATDAKTTENDDPIVVTGSRIDRAGYDAPTPTTVVGEVDLRLGNRPGIGQVLNELPQFRSTVSPSTTAGNVISGSTAADLRGLGTVRTLSLINGRRFVGSNNLNNVPQSLVKRIDVVTGGASAAWGSGAVAGVVNIILNDELEGLSMGAQTGISSRGDGARYGGDIAWGTNFADDRGHFMIAAEYINDKGIFGRNDGSRPNLDADSFTLPNGSLLRVRDVNFLDATPGGVIRSGALAGMAFGADGSLSPLALGSQTNSTAMVGGASRSQADHIAVSAPFERLNVFGRASYEFSEAARLWFDMGWTRMWTDGYQLFPDALRATATSGGLVFSRDNGFLSPAVRAQLASGPATFRMGRILDDIGRYGGVAYRYERNDIEAAIGLEGTLGGGWRYGTYYTHGELRNRMNTFNQRNLANFNNAIDAVINPANQQIVCRIALTDPNTPCRPLNLFGQGNASPDAIAYAFGSATTIQTTKLDAAGASLRGDPFSTWAGPVSIAVGVDWRREALETNYRDPVSMVNGFSYVIGALDGSFTVKEAFGEIAVPLLDLTGVKFEVNGAARYSDYSTSGGIWTWKTGGTLRLFDDLLLRTVYSRDIRSPNITELYTGVSTGIGTLLDPFRNNASVSYFRYVGGNPDLKPETANTLTIGGSYSPSFARGLSLSVDYYKIDIEDVIGTIGAQDLVTQCFRGNTAFCALIVRDASGAITTLYGNQQNLAAYKTRGLDMEASYVLPLASGDASLRFRALATRVFKLQINDGVNIYDRAGDVGDNVTFSTPKWKATGSVTYQDKQFGADFRLRYVGGGLYNSLLNIVNNKVAGRAYVDLGVRFEIDDFTLFANVNNLLDRDPPLTPSAIVHYDSVGRYFSGGVKLKF